MIIGAALARPCSAAALLANVFTGQTGATVRHVGKEAEALTGKRLTVFGWFFALTVSRVEGLTRGASGATTTDQDIFDWSFDIWLIS
ncbi:hypothetical protein Pstr01_33290 [Pseudomonas straminea]|nr:hypothetical protein Pstr01_33290 [Pseudomonas straminea]